MNVPHPEGGCRFAGAELRRQIKQAVRREKAGLKPQTFSEIRRAVAAERADRYLSGITGFVTMAQAAFILVRTKSFVRRLIYDGDLSGEFIPREVSSTGYAHWRIPTDEVRQIAEGHDETDPYDGPEPE